MLSELAAAPQPITATGTAPSNVSGQAAAMTVFTTVRPIGRFWLPLVFRFVRALPRTQRGLHRLSLIHFARWSLVREIPFNGEPQDRVKLHHPHLFFESTFNGGWEEHIDAVAHVLARGIRRLWGSSYGFPPPAPTASFKSFVRRNEVVASHFYSAYPEATARIVLSALELSDKLDDFEASVRDMTPEAFAAEWPNFLVEVQNCL